jgi:CRISPR/Cas system CSM-associated protein Csm3 (group 7 of RAMP superfamily)
MTTTLFLATLVQDSALSVSGLDRASSSQRPLTLLDGAPILCGKGLKGAALAMARRFFDPLPRRIAEVSEGRSFLRSAWLFQNLRPSVWNGTPTLRAGVGIRQKTGARAQGVLYDCEVVPAGTRWPLAIRVESSLAGDDFALIEGILGYVLLEHWARGRCWLGANVARGLGWCHLEELRAWRLDAAEARAWRERGTPPTSPSVPIPRATPTKSWVFRTQNVTLEVGEREDEHGVAWGLDMLAVGPHDSARGEQRTGSGAWARPTFATDTPPTLSTDRAIVMEGDDPVIPGASLRGPIRHAFSRSERACKHDVRDPHEHDGDVGERDPAGRLFGTIARSSRLLIRDARLVQPARADRPRWAAARLHMHAEDEFSAGSYGYAKRDAVRLLSARFETQIVVEGATAAEVDELCDAVDRVLASGAVGHLPIGGHKMRGAGWGKWRPSPWSTDEAQVMPVPVAVAEPRPAPAPTARTIEGAAWKAWRESGRPIVSIRARSLEPLASATLGAACEALRGALGPDAPIAWWCEPTIDLTRAEAPATFGRGWPASESLALPVDEVALFGDRAVLRAARTREGVRAVLVQEVAKDEEGAEEAEVHQTPVTLHGFRRFAAADTGSGRLRLREWHVRDELVAYTLEQEPRR